MINKGSRYKFMSATENANNAKFNGRVCTALEDWEPSQGVDDVIGLTTDDDQRVLAYPHELTPVHPLPACLQTPSVDGQPLPSHTSMLTPVGWAAVLREAPAEALVNERQRRQRIALAEAAVKDAQRDLEEAQQGLAEACKV